MIVMSNDTIKTLMNDVHNVFFKKWRDHVPDRNSLEWDMVIEDVNALFEKYGNDERTNQMILWFLERLEERMRSQENGT